MTLVVPSRRAGEVAYHALARLLRCRTTYMIVTAAAGKIASGQTVNAIAETTKKLKPAKTTKPVFRLLRDMTTSATAN